MSDQIAMNLSCMNPRLQRVRNKPMKQLHNRKIRLHQSAAVQELKTRTSVGIQIPTGYENEMYPAIIRSCRVLNLMSLQPHAKAWTCHDGTLQNLFKQNAPNVLQGWSQ